MTPPLRLVLLCSVAFVVGCGVGAVVLAVWAWRSTEGKGR